MAGVPALGSPVLPQFLGQGGTEVGVGNSVVPPDKLEEETMAWCREILAKSPTALKALKASFNADTDHVYGIEEMATQSLQLYYGTEEAMEGRNAFVEKRPVDFSPYR